MLVHHSVARENADNGERNSAHYNDRNNKRAVVAHQYEIDQKNCDRKGCAQIAEHIQSQTHFPVPA